MSPSDTSTAATRARAEVFRTMTVAEKSAAIEQMSEDVRELARRGIRARRPQYSPEEVEHALHRLLVGDYLADRAWPDFR